MTNPSAPAWLFRLDEPLSRLRDAPVVVAVSGGGDSVGLLRVLAAAGLRLSVAHLDHGVRGEASRADAEFVADLAGRLGLPIDLGEWAPARVGHFEADARRVRYAWLGEVARRRGAKFVAVGHTLDDQAETILHRIIRGTGIRGLAGMSPSRRLAPGVDLVRPLLGVSRREVRDYLAAIGQDFREDSSNRDTTRTRARIRHGLLPALAEGYNPNVADALVRLGGLAADAAALVASHVEELARRVVIAAKGDRIVLDRPALAGLSLFERAEVFRLAWREAGWPEGSMDARRWRWLAARVEGGATAGSIGLGIRVDRESDRLILSRNPVEPVAVRVPPVELPVPGSAVGGNGRIHATFDPESPRDESVDFERLAMPLMVRQPEPGDRFDPLGMDGRTQPLADFLRGRRVPRERRALVPLVCDGEGIVWVVGHRISHRVRVAAATRRSLGLRFEQSPGEPG